MLEVGQGWALLPATPSAFLAHLLEWVGFSPGLSCAVLPLGTDRGLLLVEPKSWMQFPYPGWHFLPLSSSLRVCVCVGGVVLASFCDLLFLSIPIHVEMGISYNCSFQVIL